ncbi:MAG: hypothetical protein ACTS8P_01350, partial [Arsenophonus sp. NC-XBC3-MAG3]
SSEMAFKIAGSMAFKEGFMKASPALLEPIMKVEVETPEDSHNKSFLTRYSFRPLLLLLFVHQS